MEDQDKKMAVLIDAENISYRYAKIILDEASNYGPLIYKRIYGDWSSPTMAPWRNLILNYSIQPIQQFANTRGKNATDSALIIDAMDLLHAGKLQGFCIVSSDSDFTRLAARLRESEMLVVGMGEKKTPASFISACALARINLPPFSLASRQVGQLQNTDGTPSAAAVPQY